MATTKKSSQSKAKDEPLVLVALLRREASPAQRKRLRNLTAGAGPLHALHAEHDSAHLVIGSNLSRVTFLSEDGKPTWSQVAGAAKSPRLEFWDHAQCSVADLSSLELPARRLLASQELTVEVIDRQAVVRFSVPELGTVEQLMRFEPGRADSLALPLFEVVFGCRDCHAESGFPVERLAKLGLLREVETRIRGEKRPLWRLSVEIEAIRRAASSDFKAPEDFKPWNPKPRKEPDPVEPEREKPSSSPASEGTALAVRALFRKLDDLTPQCVEETRLGTTAGVVHQDLLDHVSMAANDLVPLIGTVAMAGGTVTIPWLASLAAVNAGSATAPGSGLFTFLRDPRTPAIGTTPAKGGTGLLDRIAWLQLHTRDASGMMRTQNESSAGTLAATLARWGVSAGTAAALIAVGGDLDLVSEAQRIEIVERFELTDLGTIGFPGIAGTIPPAGRPPFAPPEIAGLMTFRLTGVGGTMAFGSLAGIGPISGLAIGNNGNIAGTLNLPTTTLTATVARALSLAGWLVLTGGSVGLCLLNPLACPAVVTLAALLAFLLNNVTALRAVATGVSVGLDIQWQFDPATQRVEPTVSITSRTGTITVTNTWVTPNIIANLFESIITGLGNLFNLWLVVAAEGARAGLEAAMRDAGLRFPIGATQLGLRATDGGAVSFARSVLMFFAHVAPLADPPGAELYVTQAAPLQNIRQRLSDANAIMRRDLNPAPTTPLSGNVSVACYGGLAFNQNALNHYLLRRWLNGEFELVVTGAPATLLGNLVPPPFMPRLPGRVHMWCAVPPRVELSQEGLLSGKRALHAFFDDIRVCFEIDPAGGGSDGPNRGTLLEFSFNAKMPATATFDWPVILRVLFERKAASPSDLLAWDVLEFNHPLMQPWPGMAAWTKLADQCLAMLLSTVDASSIVPEPGAPVWGRPMPGVAESLIELPTAQALANERFYVELLGRQRALYLLPALSTALLQLVDGSGAPLLAALAGTTPPFTLGTMTRADGANVRKLLSAMGASSLLP